MQHLSLRLRVFLFFCLIASGSVAISVLAAFLGYRQLGDPEAFSAFSTVIIVSGFGSIGLTLLVWLLFDENVSKSIEALAASLRVRTEGNIDKKIERDIAKYLGDLAPAASAMHRKLAQESKAKADEIAQRTARLEAQRAQLLAILSDIPIAVIVARSDHQIVFYDGQAAELMEQECPARLNGSVFDYLDESSITEQLGRMRKADKKRSAIAVKGCSGQPYAGHLRIFGGDAGYTLMLEPLTPEAARPLVYDFDLLDKPASSTLSETPLRDLAFVIFDSETTGLNPAKDEVIQLGAVRVVNGKIIEGEVFDSLVNPGIPIPPGSTEVHRIDDAMVSSAPAFDAVCADFHVFAKDSVIVAHNAPFDMAFLRRQGKVSGLDFDNPILDTVHLSAVVFGGSEEHTLDALCQRLDITIPTAVRHSALGDAIATAQAFVGVLPILEARGFNTFGKVLEEVRKHQRILKVEE